MANLTQLKLLENLHGFLLVDKPAGLAFNTVVKSVKRKFNLVKVGHGGSLDAMASGVLVLLINDANKFVGEVMGADRAYVGKIRWGLKTNTHDIHGEALGGSGASPEPEALKTAINELKGDVFQTEPRFCGVRREGSADYEIADTGEHSAFLAHVYRLSVSGDEFAVSGTKSLIVRTLVNDLGEACGCGAALESLRRVSVGKFSVEKAIPLERLLDTDIKDFASCVIPIGEALR